MKMKLPNYFYADHRARECGASGKVISNTASYTIVELDDTALADLISDADYYASFMGSDFHNNRGLVLSARATIKAINNQLQKEEK